MPVPVISTETMRAWEQATWDQGISEAEVIDRVGQAIADWLKPRLDSNDLVLFLTGKGHNGDDGKAAAHHLPKDASTVLEVDNPDTAYAALASALDQNPTFIVDCLFGIGLNRPLSEPWCALIERINQTSLEIISIDVPSGLNAHTGTTMGACVRADYTLTVGAPKKEMLTANAREWVGYIRVLTDVGLASPPSGDELFFSEASDFAAFPPRRRASDHKGTHGHLGIIAGSLGYHGAAVLAARGAMRAQPGLITLETMADAYTPIASQIQQVMTRVWDPSKQVGTGATTLLIGPGLANPDLPPALREQVQSIWLNSELPVVIDASALDWIPEGPIKSNGTRIITPHPGEAARLLRSTPKAIESDRFASVREVSSQYGHCWVILKGTHTLIGRSSGPIYINATGQPGLGQGGSGDVLAGLTAGLLTPPSLQHPLERTLRYAVWQHGQAAERLQSIRKNWTIEELPEAIRF